MLKNVAFLLLIVYNIYKKKDEKSMMNDILTNKCKYIKLDNSTFKIHLNKYIYIVAMTATQFDLAELINDYTKTYHFITNRLSEKYRTLPDNDKRCHLKLMHFLLFGI